MQIISSILARVSQLLKNHWKAVTFAAVAFVASAIASGVIGNFSYDLLKGFGTPTPPTVAVDTARPSVGPEVSKSAQPPASDEKPVVSDEQRRAEAVEKRRAMLADLLGTDAYRTGATLIAVRAERDDSPTSQAAARAAAGALVKHFDGEGRLAVEVQPVFAKSPYFKELMDGSLQSVKEAGLDRKLRAAIFATVDASCAAATSVAGVVRCTIDIRMRAVDADLQFVVSANWPGRGAGTNERDALARAVEQALEDHAAQLKRL